MESRAALPGAAPYSQRWALQVSPALPHLLQSTGVHYDNSTSDRCCQPIGQNPSFCQERRCPVSAEMMVVAWESPLPTVEKFVLSMIGDSAGFGESLIGLPAQSIARYTSLSVEQVLAIFDQFVEQGIITFEREETKALIKQGTITAEQAAHYGGFYRIRKDVLLSMGEYPIPEDKRPIIQTPEEALTRAERLIDLVAAIPLPPMEKFTFVALCTCIEAGAPTVAPGMAALKSKTGLSASTIQKSLKALREKGFITQEEETSWDGRHIYSINESAMKQMLQNAPNGAKEHQP